MDGKYSILVFAVFIATTVGVPLPEPQNGDIVPGVFISADVLKDLQEKAQQNQRQANNQPITNQPVTNLNEKLKVNPNANLGAIPIESRSQEADPPVLPNQQSVPANQLPVTNQNQPQIVSPPITNQQQTLQPVVTNNQPLLVTQQPNQPTVWVQQPNNQVLVQQPGNQFVLQQANGQLVYQQPNGDLVVQRQGNQIMVPQGNQMLVQPNNQIYVQPNNQLVLQQQPQMTGQQNGQVLIQQRGNQLLVSQPPTNQVVLQNGQIAQVVGQPTLIQTNLPNNQVNYLQTSRPVNNVQNPGTVYAVVPVNGQNNVPNTNLSNGNSYLVPVQQMPNQMYTVNG